MTSTETVGAVPIDGILGPPDLLRIRADRCPDRRALALGREVLTYGQWHDRASRAGRRLSAAGVQPGDVVLVRYSLAAFLDYAVAYAATLQVGAVAVPVAAELPADRVHQIATVGGASWLITDDLEIGRTGSAADRSPQPRGSVPPARPDPQDVAEILFTSGSTGEAQGVICPYGDIGFSWDLSDTEAGAPAPLTEAHAAAFGTNFCQEMLRCSLSWGSLVVTLPEFGMAELQAAVERYDVRTLRLTPVLARLLARQGARHGRWLARISEISVSSAFCPPEVLARLQQLAPAATVVNQYSLTESGRAKLKNVWGEGPLLALGKPVEGSQVRVFGTRGECATGETGEIQIRHVRAAARRYLAQEGPAAAAAPEDGLPPWIATGDLGYLDDQGYVYLVDRAKDIINVGGRKVSPLAVERALEQQEGVVEVAVCAVPHESLGEVVAAIVVLDATRTTTEFDLSGALQPHEIPRIVDVVEAIPRNHAGKIARDLVRAQIGVRAGATVSAPPELDVVTEEFLAICGRVLEKEVRDLDVGWYAAGGDSLGALEMLAAIEDAFDVDLPVEGFVGSGTLNDILADLRRMVEEQGEAS